MAARNSIPFITHCRICRNDLFNRFSALAAFPLQPVPRQRLCQLPASFRQSSRQLSTSLTLCSESPQHDESEEKERALKGPFDAPEEQAKPLENAPLPWYLRVQGPQMNERSLSSRQQLPNLPVDPPPLLQPILEHVSLDLGMDDLSLFDLRKLDPPPALGANLLMIMGTARSERHLHISADRFCRWLRTAYKLTPYADGLLGRNELRLKMKRKARRTKLLGKVGSTDKSDVDDGIRTGWVCVNVGSVDGVGEAADKPEQADGYVGFGGRTGGVKLVVQLMTEQKREELDLEGLWTGAIARQERKNIREAAKLADSKPMEDGTNETSKARIEEQLH